jgi:hypothetical protein
MSGDFEFVVTSTIKVEPEEMLLEDNNQLSEEWTSLYDTQV